MEEVNNKVFGKMTYDFQWEKNEELNIWGSKHNICIATSAFPGENITSEQENSYEVFKSKYVDLFNQIKDVVLEYVKKIYDNKINNFDEIKNIIKIQSILFKRDGSVVILVDCPWDGDGIGIQIMPKITISTQDAYL